MNGSELVVVVVASFFAPSLRFVIVVAKHSFGWKGLRLPPKDTRECPICIVGGYMGVSNMHLPLLRVQYVLSVLQVD